MNPEPGNFSDNCEVFNAAVRAFEDGRYEEGRRRACQLLDHIRVGGDVKSKHWLERLLERRLSEEASRIFCRAAA